MKVNCPECGRQIAAGDISLDSGWAKCASCDEVFELARLVPGYTPRATTGADLPDRPFDATAIVQREDRTLVAHLPAQGMRAGTWGLLGFMVFWLGFIAFWTVGAAAAGGAFAMFSIPFWGVGLTMLGSIVWMSRGTRSVYIDPARMTTELRCLFWRRTRSTSREDVQCAREGKSFPFMGNNQPYPGFNPYSPYSVEIVFTKGSFRFPCNSEAERAWLIGAINNFLSATPYDASYSHMLASEIPRFGV